MVRRFSVYVRFVNSFGLPLLGTGVKPASNNSNLKVPCTASGGVFHTRSPGGHYAGKNRAAHRVEF